MKRKQYLLAAVALAQRSETSTFQARCQATVDGAKHFMHRATLQQLGSIRLLKLAGSLT